MQCILHSNVNAHEDGQMQVRHGRQIQILLSGWSSALLRRWSNMARSDLRATVVGVLPHLVLGTACADAHDASHEVADMQHTALASGRARKQSITYNQQFVVGFISG